MMIRALGYSLNADFNPYHPGRLCRGRERWITPWEPEEGADETQLNRLVITGAAFEDDSARDALRGLTAAKIDLKPLLDAVFGKSFPGARLMIFAEDGHPADIPDGAEGIELYDGYRAGGKIRLPLVRWYKVLKAGEDLGDLTMELAADRVKGFAVLDKGADPAQVWNRVFALVGMSNMDSPPAHYNPAALPDLLALAKAVGVLHRDKHGPVLAVYTDESLMDIPERLSALASEAGCLLVPFAIPPMLARWDRALFELRQDWEGDEPFPVPQAESPSHWEARRDRRRRGGKARAEGASESESEE